MSIFNDNVQAARINAILELERLGREAFIPVQLWDFDLSVIDETDLAPTTKKKYKRELKTLLVQVFISASLPVPSLFRRF